MPPYYQNVNHNYFRAPHPATLKTFKATSQMVSWNKWFRDYLNLPLGETEGWISAAIDWLKLKPHRLSFYNRMNDKEKFETIRYLAASFWSMDRTKRREQEKTEEIIYSWFGEDA